VVGAQQDNLQMLRGNEKVAQLSEVNFRGSHVEIYRCFVLDKMVTFLLEQHWIL
jgi:hypothetical protein